MFRMRTVPIPCNDTWQQLAVPTQPSVLRALSFQPVPYLGDDVVLAGDVGIGLPGLEVAVYGFGQRVGLGERAVRTMNPFIVGAGDRLCLRFQMRGAGAGAPLLTPVNWLVGLSLDEAVSCKDCGRLLALEEPRVYANAGRNGKPTCSACLVKAGPSRQSVPLKAGPSRQSVPRAYQQVRLPVDVRAGDFVQIYGADFPLRFPSNAKPTPLPPTPAERTRGQRAIRWEDE